MAEGMPLTEVAYKALSCQGRLLRALFTKLMWATTIFPCHHLNVVAPCLLENLTQFLNSLLSGRVLAYICHLFFEAKLLGFTKHNNNLQPITVGCILQWLTAKVCLSSVSNCLSREFSPIQLQIFPYIKLGYELLLMPPGLSLNCPLSPQRSSSN